MYASERASRPCDSVPFTRWARPFALVAIAGVSAACAGADPGDDGIDEVGQVGEVAQAVSQAKIDAANQIILDFIAARQAAAGRTPAVCVGYVASSTQFARYCAGEMRQDTWSDTHYPPATTYANDTTLFRIGSLSKLFTGSLLAARKLDAASLPGGCSHADALCYNEKLVDHIDPIAVDCHVECADKNNITLYQLARHQSRIPRNGRFFGVIPYSEGVLLEDFGAIQLDAVSEYSNMAFALLAKALKDGSPDSYQTQVMNRLLTPLGMVDTKVTPSAADLPRLAQAPYTDVAEEDAWGPAFAGSGGYHSTLDDLMEFLKWHAGYKSVPSIDALRAETVDNKLGWGVDSDWLSSVSGEPTLVSKDGASTGFESYIGYLRYSGKGVVVLLAGADDDPGTLGRDILDALR